VEIVETFLIGAAEVSPGAHEVGGIDRDEAERFDAGTECREVFSGTDGGCGGDEGDLIARLEGLG
jgi:hypothetical protein